MATPFAHSLIGLTFGRMSRPVSNFWSWKWYLFSILAANAADFLDFILGFPFEDINLFHRGITHTIIASFIFGIIVALVARSFYAKWVGTGIASMGLYASHLLLDFFCEDGRPPYGIPLFWPFSSKSFISPYPIFKGIKHGNPGDSLATSFGQFISWENVWALGREALILLPILLFVWYLFRYSSENIGINEKKDSITCRTFFRK